MGEKYNKIYVGDKKDFCWVGFGSGSGTNLKECAKVIKPSLIFSDKPNAKLLNLDELKDIPKLVLNGYKQCGSWQRAKNDSEFKVQYEQNCILFDEIILDNLKKFEKAQGRNIDLIVLGGYMRLVKDPLLTEYKDKIINVHPADLSILDDNNQRIFVGDDAVYDVIKAGKNSTKSSVIIVDDLVDHGEILVQGPELKVWPDYKPVNEADNAFVKKFKTECLREHAEVHQDTQKMLSDWPALTNALKLIAEGRLALGSEIAFFNQWRQVYFDENALPYYGITLKKTT